MNYDTWPYNGWPYPIEDGVEWFIVHSREKPVFKTVMYDVSPYLRKNIFCGEKILKRNIKTLTMGIWLVRLIKLIH